ncbi:aminotransferase class III [Thalassospira xiamenensis]|nr:aminotransferase class III [Thalassospira xiamenensis]
MFEKVIELIPLASQTFSKSHLQYVLGSAPLFLQRGKGCRVEDIDCNEYIDYVSGLMSIVLGYCDPDVDAAIIRQMENGISFSLATELEFRLAEILKRIIPCCEMVRFGKNGSDATSAAIRLARAFTQRDKILVAGYHGWHDWYIGTTTRDLGVPECVKELTQKVPFGDADKLEKLIKSSPSEFAAFILEPSTTIAPPDGYLQSVKEICNKYGVVLIFDEIVSGFRISLGGAQEFYGVSPDLACFGKAMGNGMPISAVVGRRSIMKLMDNIFFSATFGGEALSLAASIETVTKLEKEDIPAKLSKHGEHLSAVLNQRIEKSGLQDIMKYSGNNWWPRLVVEDLPVSENIFSSLLKQFLNENGLLMGTSLNLTRAHLAPSVIPETVSRFDRVLSDLQTALQSPNPSACLNGRPIQPVFALR